MRLKSLPTHTYIHTHTFRQTQPFLVSLICQREQKQQPNGKKDLGIHLETFSQSDKTSHCWGHVLTCYSCLFCLRRGQTTHYKLKHRVSGVVVLENQQFHRVACHTEQQSKPHLRSNSSLQEKLGCVLFLFYVWHRLLVMFISERAQIISIGIIRSNCWNFLLQL